MTKKKKVKRDTVKYKALDPSVNLKTRYELIEDYDYLDKLNDKEKAWLDKFTKEYVVASFDKDPKKNLHKTTELKRDCYNKNNARNRDIITRQKACGQLKYIEDLKKLRNLKSEEDEVIQQIDNNEDSDLENT